MSRVVWLVDDVTVVREGTEVLASVLCMNVLHYV